MPIIPQQETIVQYVANSSQLDYTFAFYTPTESDIQVYYQSSTATPVPSSDILTLNVDYSVSYNADPITGGTITLLFTPTTGYYLTINRFVAASLTTNFANAQSFNGANLDTALDRLLLLIQQNQNYILERNLSYVINTYLPTAQPFTQLPPLELNQTWVGSSSGVVAATIADNPSASVLQSMLASNSPGTDGARLVGYYDIVDSTATTVQAFLANIVSFMQTQLTLSLFQPGMVIEFGGTVAPSGWLGCDGSVVSQTTYAALYTAIGATWNTGGEGAGNFRLPNFQRRTAVGSGGSGTATLGNAVGNTGGEEAHTMLANELVSHTHPTANNGGAFVGTGSGGSHSYGTGAFSTSEASATSANATTGDAFNIIQPSAVILKIIKT